MVKFLTLNTRSIKGEAKQIQLALYIKRQKADILLLQETNLFEIAALPQLPLYTVIQNPAIKLGSGTAIAIRTELENHITIHSHHNLVTGYLQTCHATVDRLELQLINIYMPLDTARAMILVNILQKHMENIPQDRTIIIGGDWNVTLEACDREHHSEKRTTLAQQLENIMSTHKMVDVWRRFHPDSNQFTYRGNQATHPKSRLDRIYISENGLHQTHTAKICPVFADHAGLSLDILPLKHKQRPAFWRFRNTLLNDKHFVDFILTIINYYTQLANEGQNIHEVWDKMKQEIQLQARRYDEQQKQQRNQQYTELEQINYLTEKNKLTEAEEKILNTVSTTLQIKIQQDAQKQITYHYNLNKRPKNGCLPTYPHPNIYTKQPQIQAIKIENKLLTEPNEIRTELRKHFQEFYSTKGHKPDIRDDIFSTIPILDPEKREKCDTPITLDELTTALKTSNPDKSPGLDGLTYELYKKFWNELGPLLLRVTNSSMHEGRLPNSMQNGIITLIPKNGDHTLLSNWRPITLLNTDYKLITKCLAGRIISVLPDLITSDQSFCVPNRTIHTNLHLIRDAIEYANMHNLPLAVISLDQASAYDCVEHPYIFYVLQKFGFGNTFIQYIRTVYQNAKGLVKTNGTLTAPFQYGRGVRQGDPLSGPLFTLTTEPFLLLCNEKLRDYGLKIPSSQNETLVTSAYADDITVFITQDEGFTHMLQSFMVYGAISGARLNIHKSKGLFVGRWRSRTDQPLGFEWNEQGGKYLGIHLGNTEAWQQKNWTELENKTKAILQKWERVSQATSYLDRKLILNQLVGAKMTHILTILQPTAQFLDLMHKMMVNFIWQGKHWKHPNFVYGRMEDGGIGVHHLPTRIQTMRFSFLQKFVTQNKKQNAWYFQAHNIRLYAQALHAEAVLKLKLNPTRFLALTPFYASALEAGTIYKSLSIPTYSPSKT
jgi:exonuclease III